MPRTGAANIGEWIQAAKKLASLHDQLCKIAESEATDSLKYQLVFGMLAGDIRGARQQLNISLDGHEENQFGVRAAVEQYQRVVAEAVATTKSILEAFNQQ